MKRRSKSAELAIALKAFDANFASDQDVAQIRGLDPNDEHDLTIAVERLLHPDFAGFDESEQRSFVALLKECLADPAENFDDLFFQLGLIFDQPLADRRLFMGRILNELESIMQSGN